MKTVSYIFDLFLNGMYHKNIVPARHMIITPISTIHTIMATIYRNITIIMIENTENVSNYSSVLTKYSYIAETHRTQSGINRLFLASMLASLQRLPVEFNHIDYKYIY